ncbi:hypothetical protein Celaphus_00011723 [Cervus elaphus hippelaphus]|uniref:Uncharacterized protein n=1 Tax=Cervus elaphus hippelaphus TaxID=46360 RepID=A0A212DEH6_CEREH|nr:hypothetical protein Celaphus_00011723 [Cervus elaphus hippelaphus]
MEEHVSQKLPHGLDLRETLGTRGSKNLTPILSSCSVTSLEKTQRERLSEPSSEAPQNSENNYKENNYKVLRLGIVSLMRIHKQLMDVHSPS